MCIKLSLLISEALILQAEKHYICSPAKVMVCLTPALEEAEEDVRKEGREKSERLDKLWMERSRRGNLRSGK